VEEVIPTLVDDSVNALLTMIPSRMEIKHIVFYLDKESAHSPNGFGASFYQTYWDIVQNEVVSTVLEFFITGWILPNFNSKTLILIPKSPNSDSIEQYRPIALNGGQHVFFSCKRGVRQGDPLSPLLLCLAEEVINRGITKLVDDGQVNLISGSRSLQVPFHCFYADDLMSFCKGKSSSLQALKNLFHRYAICSGQIVNARKSYIYTSGVSQSRLNNIVQLLGFNIGSLPFTYLGAPIFKGRPKVAYFQRIADKVRNNLSAWKASLLSMAGRIQLIKSVINSMLLHTMTIYSWPISLIKDIEKWIKKFIWSGDIAKRKMMTVAWKRVCADYDEGGLGIKSLIRLNEATNLKFCWELLHSEEQWAKLLRSRTLRESLHKSSHLLIYL